MNRQMDEKKYRERRAEIERCFRRSNCLPKTAETFVSPDAQFSLQVTEYRARPDDCNYSRGRVTRARDGRVIADIRRNYSDFWHAWIAHPNGDNYLLCGEDYQGQTVVNLTREQVRSWFPDSGYEGWGFCWTAAYPSPNGRNLAVDGCYWGAPYEVVIYDFRRPDELPYPERSRHPGIFRWIGWVDSSTFEYEAKFGVRAVDGKRYEELTKQEQEAVDATPGGLETRCEVLRVHVTAS